MIEERKCVRWMERQAGREGESQNKIERYRKQKWKTNSAKEMRCDRTRIYVMNESRKKIPKQTPECGMVNSMRFHVPFIDAQSEIQQQQQQQ